MSTRYIVESDTINPELDRLDHIDEEIAAGFEDTLTRIYAMTQEDVHVATGNLRASGRMDSDRNSDVWRGEISYGNEVVDYAEYERRREARVTQNGRTGHDFMKRARNSDHLFEDVLIEILRG